MTETARGLWALLLIVGIVLGSVFLIPLLVHLLILLPQIGWGLVS